MDARRSSATDAALVCLIFALVWAYLAADLVSLSMGLDGVIYAGIANLMAAGEGSFWMPPSFEANAEFFHDHPPLGLWLQSLAFRAAGDAFWVERAFSAALLATSGGMLVALWRAAGEARAAWWPLVLLFVMPVTTYTFKNNALESMVTVAALVGVYAAWMGRARPAYNAIVGVACLAGFLIKGPVALFPLVAPATFALVIEGSLRRAVVNSAWAVLLFAGGVLGLLAYEPAWTLLQRYFDGQLVASLAGQRFIDNGRGFQLYQLLLNVAVAGGVALAVWFAGRSAGRSVTPSRTFWSFLIIALAASLPLLISPRQFRHYLLPSMPFFALSLSILVPAVTVRVRSLYVWAVVACVTLLGMVRAVHQYGAPGSDAPELRDAELIATAIAPAPTVAFCDNAIQVRTYLARYHQIRSELVSERGLPRFVVCTADRLDQRFVSVAVLNEGELFRARAVSDGSQGK